MRNFLLPLLLASSLSFAQSPAPTSASGIVHTADVDLAYVVYGAPSAATPVIVANGGPGFAHTYLLQNDVWSKLAQQRQIVFYDQRGDGASKLLNPNAPQDMTAQVADLDAIRAKLGFQRFNLIGHSWGGLLAMGYASAHPEHVAKLILVDSAAPAWKQTLFLFSQVFPDVHDKDEQITKTLGHTPEADKQHLDNYFSELFYSQENHDRFMAHIGDAGENHAVNSAVNKAIAQLDLFPQLAKFNFPTLVMHGRFDMNVGMLTAWKTYKAIPGAKLVIFSKSGHLPFYEEPDKFVQVLGDFLSAP